MSSKKTIVVVADHGLGELVMAIPLLRNCDLFAAENSTLFILVGSSFDVEIIKSLEWRSEVIPINCGLMGFRRYIYMLRIAWRLRKYHPDLLLAPMMNERLINKIWTWLVGANLTVTSGRKWGRYGQETPLSINSRLHKVERFVEVGIQGQVPSNGAPNLILPINDELKSIARRKMKNWEQGQTWICLAPGSGEIEKHKRWPAENFIQLIQLLLAHSDKIQILLLGGGQERKLFSLITRDISEKSRISCMIGKEFKLIMGGVSQCECLVSGCSGPAHMAAVADIPIVGLYGPTNPGYTGPYSNQLRVVRKDLDCSPCYRLGFIEGCGNPVCMTNIRVDQVFQAVIDCLGKTPTLATEWCKTTKATSPSPS
tara:strand:- start:938 stop:2047 length:1110 start_codon:yes stop_codon:yes gene_type:complete